MDCISDLPKIPSQRTTESHSRPRTSFTLQVIWHFARTLSPGGAVLTVLFCFVLCAEPSAVKLICSEYTIAIRHCVVSRHVNVPRKLRWFFLQRNLKIAIEQPGIVFENEFEPATMGIQESASGFWRSRMRNLPN